MPRPNPAPVRPDINLTPLIDITLVILIILMVGIPAELGRIPVKVPSPDPPEQLPEPDEPQLVLALYEDGRMALNREPLGPQEAWVRLADALRGRDDKLVFVDAHGKVGFGELVDAVDLAREAGAMRVGLARLKPDGPLPARPAEPR